MSYVNLDVISNNIRVDKISDYKYILDKDYINEDFNEQRKK